MSSQQMFSLSSCHNNLNETCPCSDLLDIYSGSFGSFFGLKFQILARNTQLGGKAPKIELKFFQLKVFELKYVIRLLKSKSYLSN